MTRRNPLSLDPRELRPRRRRFRRLADHLEITRPRRRQTGAPARFISIQGARLIAGSIA